MPIRTRTVTTWISPREIRQYDHITFDYANPNTHPPTRVGEVIGFRSGCVLIWDYSLYDGPAPRSYDLSKLRMLSRLEDTDFPEEKSDVINRFRDALANFWRMFGRGEYQQPNSSETSEGG